MTVIETIDIATPAGDVIVAVRDGVVVATAFADHFERVSERIRRRFVDESWSTGSDPGGVGTAFGRYLDGELTALDEVEVDLGGTPFQQQVWKSLRSIPAGTTWSYGDLAAAVGSPAAVRAVGSANGANPVWIVVPCHRVIRSDGTLGGYGGGLDRKEWLLRHEAAIGS